mgnify:CR=1 FL=1
MITFGPVPSRRLGRSLGINHIPPKICTYSCVYCQLGRTLKMQVARQGFYEPSAIRAEVARLLNIPVDAVSIKAKTNEGMDAVGRGEAIACTVVAGLRKL